MENFSQPQVASQPQFGTPHSGSKDKLKVFLTTLLVLALIGFNVWYYFGVFKAEPEETEEVLLPPTEEEKATMANELDSRKADVSNSDKDTMIESLSVEAGSSIKTEDREASAQSLYK